MYVNKIPDHTIVSTDRRILQRTTNSQTVHNIIELKRTYMYVNKTPDHRIVSTDRSIQTLLYWIQHLDQYTCRRHVILRPDIEPE